jgi:hypothetical protein
MMIPIRRTALALTVATLSLAGACTDADTPLEPTLSMDPEPPAFSTSASTDMRALARYSQRPGITIAWARKWIGPEGGRLDFQGFAIDVPPGAVNRVTAFSIRLPVDPSGSERVVAQFGPHGATFAVPVTIEFPYAGTSIEGSADARVVWWDESWVDVGGRVTDDGQRLKTETDHFSVYGTASTGTERGGNGLTVSGG